ncbi:MAG: M56 family metallopeptidase [Planctomycetes bacterium]|nr:M56 family metallopeptidase [Planctomycetota bacterium]HPF14208.1 M56 family metallopeptidase [Planctomycetota bacterium]
MQPLHEIALGWLLTYLLHSTALIAAVWLLVRCLPKESNRAQECLWRCALLGSILTASLQTAWRFEPWAGRVSFPSAPAAQRATQGTVDAEVVLPATPVEPATELGEVQPRLPNPWLTDASPVVALESTQPHQDVPLTRVWTEPSDPDSEPNPEATRRDPRRLRNAPALGVGHSQTVQADSSPAVVRIQATDSTAEAAALGEVQAQLPTARSFEAPSRAQAMWSWWAQREGSRWLVGLWVLGASLGSVLLVFAWRHILERLAGRREILAGPLFEELQTLSASAGLDSSPRLFVAARLASPATLGIWRAQICVPERAQHELQRGQQRAMLGHELAHILRHDPRWFFVYRLVERILFFQPLNRFVRQELQELAEYQCDDWAAHQAGRGLDLARCLTEVAGWLVRETPQIALLPMAGTGSQLGHRVRRLLDEESRTAAARPRPWALPLAMGLLLVGTLALPGVASTRPDRGHSTPPIAGPASTESNQPLAWTLGDEDSAASPRKQVHPPSVVSPFLQAAAQAPLAWLGLTPWNHRQGLPADGADPDPLFEDLGALADQVLGLRAEIDSLAELVAGSNPNPTHAATLADLRTRVDHLQSQQDRLLRLLERLR